MSASSAPRPSRTSAFLRRPELWVFVAALLARFAVVLSFSESPHFGVQGGDSKFYHDWALRILHGQWTDGHAFYGLPGYAYLLAGLYALFGVEPFVPIALQAGLDACTAALVFAFARRIAQPPAPAQQNPNETADPPTLVGFAAALAWILFVPAQSFAVVLMPTTWLVAAYWTGVWLILRLRGSAGVWAWAALGVAIGAVAMLIATVLFLLLLALAANLARQTVPWRARAVAALLMLAGVFVGCAPAWSHNAFVAREPVLLSAHGGINFWIGNHPGADGYPKIPEGLRTGQQELLDDSIRLAREASRRPLTRPEVSRYWSAKAWSIIGEDPLRWGKLLLLKLRAFWSRFEFDDLTIIALLKSEGVLWPGLRFGFASAFGLLGIVLAFREKNTVGRWVAAAVLLHMLALMPVFITERYRLAAAPGLLALASYALWRVIEWWRRTEWQPLALSFAVLALWGVAFGRADQTGRTSSMEPYNLAVSELDAAQRLREELAATPGDARKQEARARMLRQAGEHLAKAEQIAPGSAVLQLAFGRFRLEQGEREKAKAAYTRALQLDAKFADAAINLAVLEMEEKRWAEAAALLEQATQAAPNEAGAFYLLARTRHSQGRREEARAAIAAARKLDPQNAAFAEFERAIASER